MKRASRAVLANFVSLAAIQGVNLLAPLLTLPYLARVVGFEGIGILATAAATCSLLAIFIDWGFNLTATRAISTHRDDLDVVRRIFSAVTMAKLGLSAISFVILSAILLTIPSVGQYYFAYMFSFTFIVCQALLPTWTFQGLEQMASVAIINAAAKAISATLVIVLVKHPEDFALVPLINTFVALAAVVAAMRQLNAKFGIRLSRPATTQVVEMIKDGRAIFIATAAGSIYSHGPIMILNAFTDIATVGKYSLAQKISVAAVSAFQSLAQAYFPLLSRLWVDAPARFVTTVRRYVVATQLASSLLLSVLFVFAPLVYSLLTGTQDMQGIKAVRYWLVISQLTVLAVMLNPVLVAVGRDRDMAKMYIFCGVAFLAYSLTLTWQFSLDGMLISVVIAEATIALVSLALFMREAHTKTRALGDA